MVEVDTAIALTRWDAATAYVRNTMPLDVDVESAMLFIRARPGCALLAMDQTSELDEHSGIVLGLEAQSNLRSDCGTVLASGIASVFEGDRVLVLPFTGKTLRAARYGDFAHRGRLLWVGVDSSDEDTVVCRPWWETIVMKIENGFSPLHDWCLARRETLVQSSGKHGAAIYLPDVAVFRDQTLTIVAKGPDADAAYLRAKQEDPNAFGLVPLEIGRRYVYRAKGLVVDLPGLERYELDAGSNANDYVLIRAGNLYAEAWE